MTGISARNEDADAGTRRFPYEDLTSSDAARAEQTADDIIAHGWARRGYDTLWLDAPPPWDLRRSEERSWNFYIHCWDMLDPLLMAHSITGDRRYLEKALPIALDWVAVDSTGKGHSSSFAWYDMSVGLRVYRLAYLFDAAGPLLERASRAQFWSSLEKHAGFLADDSNIAFHNNHGFYEVAGQLAMARRLADHSAAMKAAVDQASERLRRLIDLQFTPDGIHREHSPDYHRMVYRTLKALVDCGLVSEVETRSQIDTIEEALSWFVMPNRYLANFGDSDYRRMASTVASAERMWRTPAMRHAVTAGASDSPPPKDYAVFKDGGYFVARPANPDNPDWSARSYLAQTAAFHSRTHKQADDLSFIWSDRGADLLVDAGRYGYLGKAERGSDLWMDGHWYDDPNRIYVESTRAHNCLEFDGKNHPRRRIRPYGSALKRALATEGRLFAAETEIRHSGIRQSRVLILDPRRWLIVFDWFQDNLGALHDARQWFHLAPELSLAKVGDGFIAHVPTSDTPLWAHTLFPRASASEPIIAREEPVRGWWSPGERRMVPAYEFCYGVGQVSQGAIATLFAFGKDVVPAPGISRTNLSGRTALFRWSDDQGRHDVHLGRPVDGELSVSHTLKT